MSGKSGIQWTAGDDGVAGYTWNPVVGCTRVSAGCDHCYAFQLHDQRHVAWKRGRWPSAPEQYHQPFSRVQLLEDRLGDPLRWRTPRRVFVNSMSDLFHPDVPDAFICRVFETMLFAEKHTFQILTKRPERMRQFVAEVWPRWATTYETPVLPNVWLGTSVEDQRAADERIPLLLQTPAAVRFLSCEPLLGPVDLDTYLWDTPVDADLHWVIIGGESGPHARVMNARWAETLVRQCQQAGIPAFMKQLGTVWAKTLGLKDRHGGDWREWPADLWTLQMREFPLTETSAVAVAP